jgi:hypothetical protein
MPDEMDKVIAVVTCPKCYKKYPLNDTPEYAPETQPRKFPGPQEITLPCCGGVQTVQAESIKYIAKREV